MKRIQKNIFVAFIMVTAAVFGQEHDVSESYEEPDNEAVLNKLEEWQDLKFGLMMHWGPYSQWGIVESWSISPEDEDWTQRESRFGETYFEYLENYENLQKSFNPLGFNPDGWAKAARKAGMKYLVFTTKHHDGFAMYDTKESDYKITNEKTPYSVQDKPDVTDEIFKSFRAEDFMIGAYFSKPDWHSEYYWWPYFSPKDRNVNYDTEKYEDRWEKFKDFTFNQINELTTDYGDVDILWLDGGWVRPNDPNSEKDKERVDQDIDMDRIGQMARENQPGILVVDRTVSGRWENYVTPEQTIPDEALDVPWESVISMGNSFSYVPDDEYKSPQKIINSLIEIVAKGGSYLSNIAPGPNGDFDEIAYERLEAIGKWMDKNGSAIYETRAVAPHKNGAFYYTLNKEAEQLNVFHVNTTEDQNYKAPKTLSFELPDDFEPKTLKVLGLNADVKWTKKGNMVEVKLPKERDQLNYASAVQMSI